MEIILFPHPGHLTQAIHQANSREGEEVGWGSEGKGKGGETENVLGCKEAVRWGRREQSPSCSL